MSTKNGENLKRQLRQGFKRSVYWNSSQRKPAKVIEEWKRLYRLLNASFQGVRKLFVLAFIVAARAANDKTGIKDNKMYFLPIGEINNYNVLINRINFYDQSINKLIKQYDEVRKVSTGQGTD